jgi:hypothetical protein
MHGQSPVLPGTTRVVPGTTAKRVVARCLSPLWSTRFATNDCRTQRSACAHAGVRGWGSRYGAGEPGVGRRPAREYLLALQGRGGCTKHLVLVLVLSTWSAVASMGCIETGLGVGPVWVGDIGRLGHMRWVGKRLAAARATGHRDRHQRPRTAASLAPEDKRVPSAWWEVVHCFFSAIASLSRQARQAKQRHTSTRRWYLYY